MSIRIIRFCSDDKKVFKDYFNFLKNVGNRFKTTQLYDLPYCHLKRIIKLN